MRQPSPGLFTTCKAPLLALALLAFIPGSLRAQMNMNPFFSTINAPLEKQSLMLMALADFQTAHVGPDFATGMLMAEYGITDRWTAGIMAEGQKISGMPATYGGMRLGTYFHLFRDSRLLNLTLYGEYEDLNGASLYKMEVAGFGPEDLTEPLDEARHTPVRTFEQRLVLYHDRDRFNATFNFIRETSLQGNRGSDYGYALGVFVRPPPPANSMAGMAGMEGMAGMGADAPLPAWSLKRLGYGIEMIGALGDDESFGFYWNAQQHYIGPVFTYDLSPRWSIRVEPAVGLSKVSDPFMIRTGLSWMFAPKMSATMH